ncbi:hypothetical protein, partial [Klebsiella oxytoca]|uniref:hypothetical protein n=1 Tax=Klebsiella oxytoca TaxID=571 RepID=UPI001B2FEE3D
LQLTDLRDAGASEACYPWDPTPVASPVSCCGEYAYGFLVGEIALRGSPLTFDGGPRLLQPGEGVDRAFPIRHGPPVD